MFQKKYNVSLKILLKKEDLKMDNLVNYFSKLRDDIGKDVFRKVMLDFQEMVLNKYLGNGRYKKKRKRKRKTLWECDCWNCESLYFIRKWTRKNNRKIKTSIGELDFPLKQIHCKKCGKTFSFLLCLLELKPKQRITEELGNKLVSLATKTSYKKTSDVSTLFIWEKVATGKTIQKIVQEKWNQYNYSNNITTDKYEAILVDRS